MSDSVWVTGIHPGYRTKIIRVGNHTAEINRPILTDQERHKRERQVVDALRVFGKEMERSVSYGS